MNFTGVMKQGSNIIIGILPERRKDPLRITQESVMKWGKMVAGDDVDVNGIYFVQVEI